MSRSGKSSRGLSGAKKLLPAEGFGQLARVKQRSVPAPGHRLAMKFDWVAGHPIRILAPFGSAHIIVAHLMGKQLPPSLPRSFGGDACSCSFARGNALTTKLLDSVQAGKDP